MRFDNMSSARGTSDKCDSAADKNTAALAKRKSTYRFSLKTVLVVVAALCICLCVSRLLMRQQFSVDEPEFLSKAFYKSRIVIVCVFSPAFAAIAATAILGIVASLKLPYEEGGVATTICLLTPFVIGIPLAYQSPIFGPIMYFPLGMVIATASAIRAHKERTFPGLVAIVNLGLPAACYLYVNATLFYASEL